FTAYLFEQTLGLDFTVAKTFDSYPITINATYKYILQTNRGEPQATKYWTFADSSSYPIEYSVTGSWSNPTHTHALQLGVSIWR
ncbi:MAG: hypothetical protein WDA21_04445, partial [Bacilli bacterium]